MEWEDCAAQMRLEFPFLSVSHVLCNTPKMMYESMAREWTASAPPSVLSIDKRTEQHTLLGSVRVPRDGTGPGEV
jgi:hypothetical protein